MENFMVMQLYEHYGQELYMYLYSICHDSTMTEDLLQETFTKAILALSSDHSNMRAWLYMVARNLCFNSLKKRKRETLVDQEMYEGWSIFSRKDCLDEVIDQERRKILREAIFQLTVHKREIIIMQYFSGFSLKETAKILHLSYENARVLSHRAKKELKQYMEGRGYELS